MVDIEIKMAVPIGMDCGSNNQKMNINNLEVNNPRKFKQGELEIYIQGCITSFEKEFEELKKTYPFLKDFYYSDHLGDWIAILKGKHENIEAETQIQNLRNTINNIPQKYHQYHCANCGNPLLLNENQNQRRFDKGRTFYCSAGHGIIFNH